MKKIISIFILLASNVIVHGQKIIANLPEQPWLPVAAFGEVNRFSNYTQDCFECAVIKVNGAERVIAASYGKDQIGALRMDSRGKIIWATQPLEGGLIGISKHDDKIIIFYSPDKILLGTFTRRFSNINAASFSTDDGKLIEEKKLLQNAGKVWTDPKVLNNPDGELQGLFVRTTKPASGPGDTKNLDLTAAISIYSFENGMGTAPVVTPAGTAGDFMGVCANDQKHVYIATHERETLRVDKVDAQGKILGTAFTPLDFKYTISRTMKVDGTNGNSVLIAVQIEEGKRDVANQLIRIDFSGQTPVVAKSQVKLDKEFKKSLNFVKPEGIAHSRADIETLTPVKILQYQDKIVLVQEMRQVSPGYTNQALVLSFFDKQLRNLSAVSLDKLYNPSIGNGRSLGYHMRNEKLYLVSQGSEGSVTITPFVAVIDMSAMKVENAVVLQKPVNKICPLEPGATLWNDNNFMVVYLSFGSLSKGAVAQPQVISY